MWYNQKVTDVMHGFSALDLSPFSFNLGENSKLDSAVSQTRV